MAGSSKKGDYYIRKFNGTNFTIWKQRMMDVLVNKGLAAPLKDRKEDEYNDDQWEELDARARAMIWLHLGEFIFSTIMDKTTTFELWDSLCSAWDDKSAFNKPSDVLVFTTNMLHDALLALDDYYAQTWILDSGASFHVTSHREWFATYLPMHGSLNLGDSHQLEILGIGDVKICMVNSTQFMLKDVRHEPQLSKSLVSAEQLDDLGYTIVGNDSWLICKANLITLKGQKSGTLYSLYVSSVKVFGGQTDEEQKAPAKSKVAERHIIFRKQCNISDGNRVNIQRQSRDIFAIQTGWNTIVNGVSQMMEAASRAREVDKQELDREKRYTARLLKEKIDMELKLKMKVQLVQALVNEALVSHLEDLENKDDDEDEDKENLAGTSGHQGPDDDDDQGLPGTSPSSGGASNEPPPPPPASQPETPSVQRLAKELQLKDFLKANDMYSDMEHISMLYNSVKQENDTLINYFELTLEPPALSYAIRMEEAELPRFYPTLYPPHTEPTDQLKYIQIVEQIKEWWEKSKGPWNEWSSLFCKNVSGSAHQEGSRFLRLPSFCNRAIPL
ncbi:hypothetical protein L7F22_005267 [Adiantum nelumboides]|nr:hypothetical protein [Adiantum nelumboides]